jgi:glutamate-5-semialdehyde dehydrogenase
MNFKDFAKPILEAKSKQFKISEEQRKLFLSTLAELLEKNCQEILAANKKDLAKMDPSSPLYDRLELTEKRIMDIKESVLYVNNLPYLVGKEFYSHRNSSGLEITKVRVPFGIIGIIYESRPNVTIDCAALCVYSGNCVILRGGSDAYESNKYIVELIQTALTKSDIPKDTVGLLPPDRELVAEMLKARDIVDLVIPRGGKDLIDRVRKEATMPAIETGAGVCHVYVHEDADVDMAAKIIVNAKVQRPSVCNALDTALIHEKPAPDLLALLSVELKKFAVKIYADEIAYKILKAIYPEELLFKASHEDYGREFLSLAMSVKIVDDLDEAITHISEYSSKHTEAIVCDDMKVAEEFLQRVDAASVLHNASTRFTDGFEFGLGAEIGNSTQKLHARGPMGIEEIMTYKWVSRGKGIVRP